MTFMDVPTDAPQGSPDWWLPRLVNALNLQWDSCKLYQDYYDGRHPFDLATDKYKDEFTRMLRKVNDNWIPIVIDSVEERLHIQGFRMGDGSPDTDDVAWHIWQRNGMDADSQLLHSTSLINRIAYAMVWADSDQEPVITAEHPSQVYVRMMPGSRRVRQAAIKLWRDDWSDARFANVYLPEGIYKYTSKGEGAWTFLEWIPNPLKVVPIVPFVNRGDLFGVGRSEAYEAISTQDQINKIVKDMMVASEFAAYPQRWATGIDDEEGDTEDGVARGSPFTAAISRLWTVGAPDASFGEFRAADLGNYVKAYESRIQSLASRTRTPPHYLLGQSGQFPSGESLRSAETGLVAKTKRRMVHFGEAWEEVMRLAFMVRLNSDPRARAYMAEAVWVDPESRTESEHVDSLVKLASIGVPKQALWERAGFSPPEVARFRLLLVQEALAQAMADEARGPDPDALAQQALIAQRLYLPVEKGVLTQEEARDILAQAGADLQPTAGSPELAAVGV